jgi:hypothetical protein
MERNTSAGSVPMHSASQTDFSAFSDLLLESANLRKFQKTYTFLGVFSQKTYTFLVE